MSAYPTFSVCIPNYNYGRYLKDTIGSVLRQSYPYFEIVVVDNASTDDSVRVVESITSDRIKLFRNPYNVGFAPNLDRAAMRAVNEFLIMLSADDLMLPGALETYADVIRRLGPEAHNSLICSNVQWFNESRIVHVTTRDALVQPLPLEGSTGRIARADVTVHDGLEVFRSVFPRMKVATFFCSTAYSRVLYERVGGYASTHQMAPDAHFSYKALLSGAQVVFVDQVLFGYRVHEDNQTQANRAAGHLKPQLDHYQFSQQFSDLDLERAGLRRVEICDAMVEETCLNSGLLEIRAGNSAKAFRLLMFALATYPAITLRRAKTYALLALLVVTPPVGRAISRLGYAIRQAGVAGRSRRDV